MRPEPVTPPSTQLNRLGNWRHLATSLLILSVPEKGNLAPFELVIDSLQTRSFLANVALPARLMVPSARASLRLRRHVGGLVSICDLRLIEVHTDVVQILGSTATGVRFHVL